VGELDSRERSSRSSSTVEYAVCAREVGGCELEWVQVTSGERLISRAGDEGGSRERDAEEDATLFSASTSFAVDSLSVVAIGSLRPADASAAEEVRCR
jgi:hypothetical protein